MIIRVLFASLVALVAVGTPAHAQACPSKPIRMIVAFAVAGSADINTRTVA